MFVLPYKHFLMIRYHFFLNLSIISCKFFPFYKFLFHRTQVSYEIKKEHQVRKPDAPFSLYEYMEVFIYDTWSYNNPFAAFPIVVIMK